MANDVSYFKIPGDNTQYSFNDADAETSITTLNGNIGALSGLQTRAVSDLVTAINSILVGSATAPSSYPTRPGTYRVAGTLFAGLPQGANAYGVLFIIDGGTYQMHTYLSATKILYVAYVPATTPGTIVAPSAWNRYDADASVNSKT